MARLERRWAGDGRGGRVVRGLVIVTETEAEREMLDAVFGSKVGVDGLIGKRVAECRLSDGYADHYIYVPATPADRRA